MSEMNDLLEDIRDKLDELVAEVRDLKQELSENLTSRSDTSFAGEILSALLGIEIAIKDKKS